MASATRTNGRTPRVPLTPAPPQPDPPRHLTPGAATPNLDAAVLRVQAKAAKLACNAVGQIQHRQYGYVTLTAVWDEVLPLLVEEQLLWRAYPTTLEDGKPGLRYRMTHLPSSEDDGDTMPLLVDSTMQALGSGITYSRRYSALAYLGLTVDKDDDGRGANEMLQTGRPPVDRYAEAEAAHADLGGTASGATAPQPAAKPPKPTERRITANQRTKLLIPHAQKAKLTDGEFANVMLIAAGEPPRTWSSSEHASQTLDRLLDHLPARLKDAVLEGIGAAGEAKAKNGAST